MLTVRLKKDLAPILCYSQLIQRTSIHLHAHILTPVDMRPKAYMKTVLCDCSETGVNLWTVEKNPVKSANLGKNMRKIRPAFLVKSNLSNP